MGPVVHDSLPELNEFLDKDVDHLAQHIQFSNLLESVDASHDVIINVHPVGFAHAVALRTFVQAIVFNRVEKVLASFLDKEFKVGTILNVVRKYNDACAGSLDVTDRVDENLLPGTFKINLQGVLVDGEIHDEHDIDRDNQNEVDPRENFPLVCEHLQRV
jgi:hypothetical protein